MKLALVLASIIIAAAVPLRASIIIDASPALQTVSKGALAQVQIDISGLGQHAAPSVGAYDLNIAFDPSILSFVGLTFGDPLLGDQLDLSHLGPVDDFTPSTGLLEFYEVSLDPAMLLDTAQADHFSLATLRFQALSAGSSFITPSLNALSDAQGLALTAGAQSGRVDVLLTPEPSGFPMILLATLAVITAARLKPECPPNLT